MSALVSKIITRGVRHETAAPTLELINVSVAYAEGANGITSSRSDQFALQNVSFQVSAGERIAVVGPNGAGKSTLFKLIVGTIKPNQGEVNIYGHGPGGHICIAYVPQRSQIDWTFPVTVEDVVMMGRVGQIGLFRWPHRRDWERVFIARALAQEAELLLMDEPLAGLDVPNQEAIFETLDSLRPDGVTVLLATHDLDLAAERFDRMMLLNKRIVAFDRATAVLQPDNLLQAYGGHMHVMDDREILLTDECCDHHDEGVEGLQVKG